MSIIQRTLLNRQFTAATNPNAFGLPSRRAPPPPLPLSQASLGNSLRPSRLSLPSHPTYSQPLSLPGWGASDPVYSEYNANLPHPAPLDLSRLSTDHPAHPGNQAHQAYQAHLAAGGAPVPIPLPLLVSIPTPIYHPSQREGQGWDMEDDGDTVMESEWQVDEVGDAVMAGDVRGSVGMMGPEDDSASSFAIPASTLHTAPAAPAPVSLPAYAPAPSAFGSAFGLPKATAFPRLPAVRTDNAPALFPEATCSAPSISSLPTPAPVPTSASAPASLPAAFTGAHSQTLLPSASRWVRAKKPARPKPYVRPAPRHPVPACRPDPTAPFTLDLILPPSPSTARFAHNPASSSRGVPALPVYVMVWLPDGSRAWAFEAPGNVPDAKIWCEGRWAMLSGLPVADLLRRMAEELKEGGFDAEAVDLEVEVGMSGSPVVQIGDRKFSNWTLARFLKHIKKQCGRDEVELSIKEFRKSTPALPATPAPAFATFGANPYLHPAITPAPPLAPSSPNDAPSPDGEAPATPLQNVHALPPSQIPCVHIQRPTAAFRSFKDIMAGISGSGSEEPIFSVGTFSAPERRVPGGKGKGKEKGKAPVSWAYSAEALAQAQASSLKRSKNVSSLKKWTKKRADDEDAGESEGESSDAPKDKFQERQRGRKQVSASDAPDIPLLADGQRQIRRLPGSAR